MELKPITGYEGYSVSKCGRIFSTKQGALRERSSCAGKDGYKRVILANGKGGYDTKYVHRLVALEWLGVGTEGTEVNHKDHDKGNNSADNLEWVTHRANLEKAREVHGNWLVGGNSAKAIKQRIVDENGEVNETRWWKSARDAAKALGNVNAAANICRALQTGRVAYGARWEFVV